MVWHFRRTAEPDKAEKNQAVVDGQFPLVRQTFDQNSESLSHGFVAAPVEAVRMPIAFLLPVGSAVRE